MDEKLLLEQIDAFVAENRENIRPQKMNMFLI